MKVMQIYSLHGHEYGGQFLQPSSSLLHLEQKLTVSQKSYDGCNFLLINISIYNIPINRKEFDKHNGNILHVQINPWGIYFFKSLNSVTSWKMTERWKVNKLLLVLGGGGGWMDRLTRISNLVSMSACLRYFSTFCKVTYTQLRPSPTSSTDQLPSTDNTQSQILIICGAALFSHNGRTQ